MASDLISRDAIRLDIKNWQETITDFRTLRDIIDGQPAVDAVEVVRCKDCKHCFLWKIPFCDAEIGLLPIPHNIETWYCPLGERKENAVD